MKSLVVAGLKGGTGKSTITAQLGLALVRRGFQVAFLDLDIHGPNMHKALGLDSPPRFELDTAREVILPYQSDGWELITLASHWGEGNRVLWRGEAKFNLAKQLLTGTIDWGSPDYLLIDCPPSQGEEIIALFEYIVNPFGILLVFQPSDFSTADGLRMIDLIRDRRFPFIGVVSNMDGCTCPSCHFVFHPLLTKHIDINGFCNERGLIFLMSIPMTRDITPYSDKLAELVINSTPQILPAGHKRRMAKRALVKTLLTT